VRPRANLRGRCHLAASSEDSSAALTGFCLASGISFLHNCFVIWLAADAPVAGDGVVAEIGIAAGLQGSGTALILAVVRHVHAREKVTRAKALAEIRMQQRRMDPHFLCSVLNTVAALAMVAPSKAIQAVGCLRQFLRASFAQEERARVPLEEELALVHLFGNRVPAIR
jgi:hypothetical protein